MHKTIIKRAKEGGSGGRRKRKGETPWAVADSVGALSARYGVKSHISCLLDLLNLQNFGL